MIETDRESCYQALDFLADGLQVSHLEEAHKQHYFEALIDYSKPEFLSIMKSLYESYKPRHQRDFPRVYDWKQQAEESGLVEQNQTIPLDQPPELPVSVQQASSQMAQALIAVLPEPKSEWKRALEASLEQIFHNVPDHPVKCTRCHDSGLLTIYTFLERRAHQFRRSCEKQDVTFFQAARQPNSPSWEYPGIDTRQAPDPKATRLVARCSCSGGQRYSGVGSRYHAEGELFDA